MNFIFQDNTTLYTTFGKRFFLIFEVRLLFLKFGIFHLCIVPLTICVGEL